MRDQLTEVSDAIERVIIRRVYENKVDGYTLEMAREIAALSLPVSNKGENAELIELLRDKSEDGAFSDFERHLFLKSAQAIAAADARIGELEAFKRDYYLVAQERDNLTHDLAKARAQRDKLTGYREYENKTWREAHGGLKKALDASKARAEAAEARLWGLETELSTAIGTNRFLDPPDGGDVPLSEQVRRMREALETAETLLEEARRALAPFIRLADNVFGDDKNATVADEVTLWCFNDTDITFGDLRRARATLDRIGKSNVEGKGPGEAEAGQDAAKSPA